MKKINNRKIEKINIFLDFRNMEKLNDFKN